MTVGKDESMALHRGILNAAAVLLIGGMAVQAEAIPARFPTTLAENPAAAPDWLVTGPPDDAFLGIRGISITYDFGADGVVVVNGPGQDFNVYEDDLGVPEFSIIVVSVSADNVTFFDVTA